MPAALRAAGTPVLEGRVERSETRQIRKIYKGESPTTGVGGLQRLSQVEFQPCGVDFVHQKKKTKEKEAVWVRLLKDPAFFWKKESWVKKTVFLAQ